MTITVAQLEVRPAGRGFAIYAGSVCLRRGFKTAEAAAAELAKRPQFYAYWAGSAGVSVDNSTPAVVEA